MPFWWSSQGPHASGSLSRRVRVLVIDENALMRELLVALLARDPQIEVVAAVADPLAAFSRLRSSQVDVITLDVDMPRVDALAFVETLMRTYPRPLVAIASPSEQGAAATFRALELGAVDFIVRPTIDLTTGMLDSAGEVVRKVKAAVGARFRTAHGALVGAGSGLAMGAGTPGGYHGSASRLTPKLRWDNDAAGTPKVIALSAAAGGVEAFRSFLAPLPHDSPGIVLAHHMPHHFTKALAERLDGQCALHVSEAKAGDRVLPGRVLIAPADSHMQVVRSGDQFITRIFTAEPVHHHRPSADILFRSCAQYVGANTIAIVLTGAGLDGAHGLRAVREAGGYTIAQDEESSVVFGTAKEAIALGAVRQVLPLDQIPAAALAAAAAL